jgi:hypothetical protein
VTHYKGNHRAEQLPERKACLRPHTGCASGQSDHRYRRCQFGGGAQPRLWVPKRALPGHAATVDNVVRVGDSFPRAVVAFVSKKSKNKTKVGRTSVSEEAQLALFGPPLLLEGEDTAAHDEFLIRIRAAVNPVDIIDDMFIADVVSLEWEVLRWRRLKLSLIRTRGLKALEGFLATKLEYDLYSEHFSYRFNENSSGQSSGRPGGFRADAGVQVCPE